MYEEKTLKEDRVHDGRIIKVFDVDVELFNGEKAKREVARHPGGACAIAVGSDKNIYLVKQYRKPVEEHTWEIPAGKLEAGEEPEKCALRELEEEAGIVAGETCYLGCIYPSPGYCDEKLYIYLATDLVEGKNNPDPGEFLECKKIHIEKCIEMIDSGEIKDAKTIVAVLRASRILCR